LAKHICSEGQDKYLRELSVTPVGVLHGSNKKSLSCGVPQELFCMANEVFQRKRKPNHCQVFRDNGVKFLCEHSMNATNRVLARIIFKRAKKHVATTMTRRLWEIFLVKCQKQAFSFFNKREAKVYCYAFLHVLKRDTCIKHEKTI
jgi:hypothetical protein